MTDLPVSTSIRPRPLLLRMAWRETGNLLPPASEDEIRDAIRALRDLPHDDPINHEALRVLDEVGFPVEEPA
jgi:hypothetical protein